MRAFFLLCLLSCVSLFSFEKIIIWEYPLYSHTHSYFHYGFYRAFKHMGYDVYWFDSNSDISDFDFSNSLFISEGGKIKSAPKRDDCFYLTHHFERESFPEDFDMGWVASWDVFTEGVIDQPGWAEIEPYIWMNDEYTGSGPHYGLAMPWATDLLPYEIDKVKEEIQSIEAKKQVVFIGTLGYDNQDSSGKILELFYRGQKSMVLHSTQVIRGKTLKHHFTMLSVS